MGTLSRTTSFKPRATPLARASKNLCATKRAQRRAYQLAAETEDPWCACCGRPAGTEHSHLYSQRRYPEHRSNPLNWLLLDRGCHELFEHDKAGFAARFPVVWAEVLRRLPLIDEAAFKEFQLKHEDLIPSI